MSNNLIKLINENSDLPIFAWVNGEVCEDDSCYWLGKFSSAEIREYAKVEPYGWNGIDYVFKDEPEDYIDYLLEKNDDMTEKDAVSYIANLDFKKAIFIYVELPKDF